MCDLLLSSSWSARFSQKKLRSCTVLHKMALNPLNFMQFQRSFLLFPLGSWFLQLHSVLEIPFFVFISWILDCFALLLVQTTSSRLACLRLRYKINILTSTTSCSKYVIDAIAIFQDDLENLACKMPGCHHGGLALYRLMLEAVKQIWEYYLNIIAEIHSAKSRFIPRKTLVIWLKTPLITGYTLPVRCLFVVDLETYTTWRYILRCVGAEYFWYGKQKDPTETPSFTG